MTDVGRKCVRARADRPDVQVVYSLDAFDRDDGSFNVCKAYVSRRADEQNVGRFQDQTPRTIDDYQADEYAADGIGPKPAKPEYQYARDDRRCRAEKITHYVQERAADVEIVLVIRMQKLRSGDVYYEAASC